MKPDFSEAVNRVTEVVMFENWLRFYFLVEEDDKLFIRLPQKAEGQLQERYPHLYGLAERLNNAEISHPASVNAVCLFVASEIDGFAAMPEGLVSRVFDSSEFHHEMQLFSTWVQGHEEQLDQGFLEFSAWQEKYTEWKQRPEVREYSARLQESAVIPTANLSATVH